MSENKAIKKQLGQVDTVNKAGKFEPNWRSLQQYNIPQWYEDAKFGIFIHWGVYAVPAFGNEWYARHMYVEGTADYEHHLETYGPHHTFGYKDFIPMFQAEKFNADEWLDLVKKSGAKFIVPVAEHHDGFAMYDSDLTEWKASTMGPKRDIIGELAEAARKHHIVFGLSSHRAENWWFYNGGMNVVSDVQDPLYAGLYGPAQPNDVKNDWKPEQQPNEPFLDDWLARTAELVDKYEPQIVWFDWWIQQPAFKPYLQRFAAYYYNKADQWQRGVAINYKDDAFEPGTAVFDVERGQLDDIRAEFWQTDTSVSENSWSHIHHHQYKTASTIIGDLVDIVSKNGALLLNIGPRADGTIPEEEQQMLLEIGKWLNTNGRAIFSTRPWKVYGEGPTEVTGGSFSDTKREAFTAADIRFTTRDNKLYAIVLAVPEDGQVKITSLASTLRLYTRVITTVKLLGSSANIQWSHEADGLYVTLPENHQLNEAFVLEIS